jgi:hypothetical protein
MLVGPRLRTPFCHRISLPTSPVLQVTGRSALGYCIIQGLARFYVPPSLLSSAFGGEAWQQRGFKVMLSVHKDGACIAGGHLCSASAGVLSNAYGNMPTLSSGATIGYYLKQSGPRASSAVVKPCLSVVAGGPGARITATLSCDKRTQLLHIPKAFTPHLSGCRLAVIRAAAPHHLQVRFVMSSTVKVFVLH